MRVDRDPNLPPWAEGEAVTKEPVVSPVAAPVWLEGSKAEGLMLIR